MRRTAPVGRECKLLHTRLGRFDASTVGTTFPKPILSQRVKNTGTVNPFSYVDTWNQ
ncbi:hypothetical protein [Spirosoma linguale]|uniref:hypothetical protein n=1 Tax=Spirosoma linguale TaxID=108 RepID=UPI000321CB50